MYIRISKSHKGKYELVYLVEGYRDKDGKIRQRIIKRYGNLKDLVSKDPNALEKLKAQAKLLSKRTNVEINSNHKRTINESIASINYGYLFLEKIYNELGLDSFLKQVKKTYKFQYDLNSIMKMLIFSRVLHPGSKLKAFENQNGYFEAFNNKLVDIYRSLSVMNKIQDDLQVLMHKKISTNYKRDCSLVLYDLTNYYFEIEKEDELKKVGMSKEKKRTPIIQMGLLIDKNKIPIGYQLFPGNTHDSKTAIPMINKLKEKFNIKKIILIADKDINTSKNFAKLVKKGDGYIVSQKIRGSSKEFIAKTLDDKGYVYWGDDFKYKEVFRERQVKTEDGDLIILKEKVVIYWTKNFDQRQKNKRENLNEKIQQFIDAPLKLKASNAHGIKRYIKTMHIDKKTGEVKKINPKNIFNQEKYDHDVALDGFYAIVTSELDKPVKEILASYHELWKIEESFKVIKSDLEGRPVYVQRNDRIEGHFLTCFITLTILRILEHQLKNKYSISRIKNELSKATCKPYRQGIYIMEPQGNVITSLENVYKTHIHYETTKYEEIKRFKRELFHNKPTK